MKTIQSKTHFGRTYYLEQGSLRVRVPGKLYTDYWCVGPRDPEAFTEVNAKTGYLWWTKEQERLIAWYLEHAEEELEARANK